ncbi:MAG TPA: nickel-binding protein [Acidimicrobiales bacterium]|nr:nickel-binding protein [Acidimicrobiales bacterium]
MATYLVDRQLAGITMDDLGKAQGAAIRTADEFRSSGRDVSYLRSIFEPTTGHCQCLFEGSDESVVAEVNDIAGLPYDSITEVLDLPKPAR